jgi:uncharacterized membrane protein
MSVKHQTHEAREGADPIGENIQTIADLHKHAERNLSPQQRAIENVTDFLGRPRFLFITLLVVTLWIVVNILLPIFGLQNFDPPPFTWLVGVLSLGALLEATLILITQNRQDVTTQRNRQLDLQISLLLDEKMSKLITMVNELRQAHPDLKDSTDPQVEALKKTVDPHRSLETLNQLLDEGQEQDSRTS